MWVCAGAIGDSQEKTNDVSVYDESYQIILCVYVGADLNPY